MWRRRLLLLTGAALVAVVPGARGANDPLRPQQWNLDRVQATSAWPASTGGGVVVAVVDTGVDLKHEDLEGRLVPGRDFVDGDDDPQDENGHGTHVAGIIAAAAGNGRGIEGVAPGVKVMPVRVLDGQGNGTIQDVVSGIRYAATHGAKVINLSLGEQSPSLLGPAFHVALQEAWANGAIPVVSSGNNGGPGYGDEPVVVVTATNRADVKPSYANGVGGARWGIAAPGGELPDEARKDDAILSTYWKAGQPNVYAYLAGTSQAAPHVSAALAILLGTGKFTPQQAIERLLSTARDLGARGPDADYGAGELDLAAATRDLVPARVAPPAVPTTAPATTTITTTTTTTTTAPAPSVPPPVVPLPPPSTRVVVLPSTSSGRPGRALAIVAAVALIAADTSQLGQRLRVALGRARRP